VKHQIQTNNNWTGALGEGVELAIHVAGELLSCLLDAALDG